jgi:hypothetical protein
MEDVARDERWFKEWKALDMVPMHMAKKHVRRDGQLPQQLLAEKAQTGSAVEYQTRGARLHFDTTRIPTDQFGANTWRWDTAAHAPKRDLHPRLSCG